MSRYLFQPPSDPLFCEWCGDMTSLMTCGYFCSLDLCTACRASHTQWDCVTREQVEAHIAEIENEGIADRRKTNKGPKIDRMLAANTLLYAMT